MIALVSLAGCLGGSRSENKAGENEAPTANLSVDDNTGWTGESFSFDPRESKDPDGEIARYKIDFGDRTVMEYDARTTNREIDHTYLEGGEYTVTLTVTDDGADNAGALSSTDAVRVAVNQRTPFEGAVIYAGNGSQQGRIEYTIPTTKGLDRIESQVTVTNAMLIGSSKFKIELKDPDNITKETKEINIDANSNGTETLRHVTTDDGTWRLVITAVSGGGRINGENRAYYDVGFSG